LPDLRALALPHMRHMRPLAEPLLGLPDANGKAVAMRIGMRADVAVGAL
jgi:hypothetical protein